MKSVFGFRVRLGNPDLDFENLNPDFPIERTLRISIITVIPGIYLIEFHEKKNQIVKIDLPESFTVFQKGFFKNETESDIVSR